MVKGVETCCVGEGVLDIVRNGAKDDVVLELEPIISRKDKDRKAEVLETT